MKNTIFRLSVCIFALSASEAALGQTQVPNTFQSGQPARAAEVNANFSAVETGINDNDNRIMNNETDITNNSATISSNTATIAAANAAIQSQLGPVVLDGNGNEIGLLVSIGENHLNFEVITQQGYLFSVSPRDGRTMVGPLYFASSDCTGTGYTDASFFNGYVVSLWDLTGVLSLYYVDKNSVPLTNFSVASVSTPGGCIVQAGPSVVYPVLLNDPTVTGISTDTYQLPIKIERPQ